MDVGIELADHLGTKALAISGWIVREPGFPVRWGLISGEIFEDITDKVIVFRRADSHALAPESTKTERFGFFTIVEGELSIKFTQLVVGTVESPAQLALELTEHSSARSVECFFKSCWQPLRLKIIKYVSELPISESSAGIHHRVNALALAWSQEISSAEGLLHPSIEYGIDHNICTATGEYFVEGWLRTKRDLRRSVISVAITGLASSRTLFVRNAFKRTDIGGPTDNYSGFVVAACGYRYDQDDPVLIIEAQNSDTGEIYYSKMVLSTLNQIQFARTYWARVLDLVSVHPKALKDMIALSARPHASSFQIPELAENKKTKSENKLRILVVNADLASVLRNILSVTLSRARLIFSEISLITSGEIKIETRWPIADRLQNVKQYASLSDAVLHSPSDATLLILDASSIVGDNFGHDISRAQDFLERNPGVEFVVLGVNGSVLVSGTTKNGVDCDSISKGLTLPPILFRASALQRSLNGLWPHPFDTTTIVRVLRQGGAARGRYQQCENVEIFYVKPSSPFLSLEQSRLLFSLP